MRKYAAIIASFGFAAFACGGGAEEGSASSVPNESASSSAPPQQATAHAIATKPTATATSTATATAPPPDSALPAPFNAANDARRAADTTLATLIATKETSCDVIATALSKFTTDNSAAYSVWNAEYSKLSPEQMKLARSRAIGGPDLAASLGGGGGFKVCLDQKNPKLGLAMRSFLGVATYGK